MVSVCFYFQVHQPYRLRKYHIFEIGNGGNYFDDAKNEAICKKVSQKCYLPTNRLIYDLIYETDGRFKVSYSITGVALEQFDKYCPEVIESFIDLIDTGAVELLDETYYHSLAFLYSEREFREQVKLHRRTIREIFNYKPKVFRNTELIYNNRVADIVEDMGYKGVLAEGADHILEWRSPNFLYKPITAKKIKLLLKNYRLSDDIAFRFSQRSWDGWPLTSDKFAVWISAINGNGNVVNLFMDYETFGEHQWEDTGIFNFLRHLPNEILKNPDNDFKTPSEVIDTYEPVAELDIQNIVSWADIERDLSAWLGNKMQQTAIEELYSLEESVRDSNDVNILEDWRKMQIADHFYYMCTKWFNDGDVHKYFNAYDRPHDAFITFMNVMTDLKIRLKELNSY
mgnify:CR=1 FL=1